MYPLVRELAAEGIPVVVSCRVLEIARQRYYRWLAQPIADRDLDAAWIANAVFDAHRDDPEFGYRFLGRRGPPSGPCRGGRDRVAALPRQRLVRGDGQEEAVEDEREAADARTRRPGPPPVHRGSAEPALAHRHHRAPDRRGHEPPRDSWRLWGAPGSVEARFWILQAAVVGW